MTGYCEYCKTYSRNCAPIRHRAWCIENQKDDALYGVRVVVDGREQWAWLPNGAKGYATFAEAQEVADIIGRRYPAFVRRRGK